jgi:hypothetical protein
MVLNELSLIPLAKDKASAKQWMDNLVELLKSAVDIKLKTLRTGAKFSEISICDSYPISQWFNDNDVNKDVRDFVLTYVTQSPILGDLDDNHPIRVRSEKLLGDYNNSQATELTHAYLLDALAISFASDQIWDYASLDIDMLESVIEDKLQSESSELGTSETWRELTATIKHACFAAHLEDNRSWIDDRIKSSVENGLQLSIKIKEWYPSLILCEKAKKQLRDVKKGDINLQNIIDCLEELDRVAKEWYGGRFQLSSLVNCKSSDESDITIQMYGRQREFNCPDNKTRLFRYHLKSLQNAWRIHFYPDDNDEFRFGGDRKILVGYIGPHLKTASDPT